jgi:hypothetical protein
MSEAPKTNGNGHGHTTIISAGVKLGNTVLQSLSPNFLALLILNVLMLGLLYWFVDARARYTVELLNKLLAACLDQTQR